MRIVFTGSLSLVMILVGSCLAVSGPEDESDAARAEFFESKVRPILAGRCFGCHGEEKQQGGLRLDSPEAIRAGGDTGPAIDLDEPSQSPLIEAIRHEGPFKMPPKGKLDNAEIDSLTEWVRQGALWPVTDTMSLRPESADEVPAITDADRSFWAFQPVRDFPPPAVNTAGWTQTSIDPFILAKLEESGLQPSPPADRRTLLRRVTFDLIGLPPTPEEVEDFLEDGSPEAFARVVDRLLASPHYGERWGRHWLDIARYGEDQAHSFKPRLYPNGFRYRDWVAAALNDDMPYDRFITEQIAGDLLEEPSRIDRLAALGFFALGPVYYGDPQKFDQVDDRIDTMARGFLGLTVACARCHDHKFDPIPTADYYALAGVFMSSDYEEAAAAPADQVAAYDAAQEAIEGASWDVETFLRAESARVSASEHVDAIVGALRYRALPEGQGRPSTQGFAKSEGLDAARLAGWVTWLERSKDLPRVAELLGAAEVAGDKGSLSDGEALGVVRHAAEQFELGVEGLLADQRTHVEVKADDKKLIDTLFDDKGPLRFKKEKVEKELISDAAKVLAGLRAELKRLEEACPPKYPVVHTLKDLEKPVDSPILVRGDPKKPGGTVSRRFLSVLAENREPFSSGSGRLELARAIASPENPLTARVMVNRIWQHHFGRGLVGTPSNFGQLGERPSHPELLDHIASLFVARGWSMKAVHREILLSATYQQSSRTESTAYEADPENRLLGRMNRRRLEVEAWRDALLAVSGRLDPKIGGPSASLEDRANLRRTFYAAVSRHNLSPLLRLFDFPDPNITGAERSRTTVPLQALVVLNDELLVDNARALAARVLASADDDEGRIQSAYALLFGRVPTDEERRLALDYLSSPESEGSAPDDGLNRWERYAQALLGTNEFVFID